jgi:hypothetical protein
MKDKLMTYIDLLFAGTQDTNDIRQEILQNTLDRYDDLIAQGKTPEAAYQLSISGIGDISQLLNEPTAPTPSVPKSDISQNKLLRSVAIALYILCPVPLFLMGNAIGLCGLLLMVATATALMVYTGKTKPTPAPKEERPTEDLPQGRARKSVKTAIRLVVIVLYLPISFFSGAWHITWLMFLMLPALTGLVDAVMDLKEEK